MGKPTTLTAEVQQAIVAEVLAGCSLATAAALNGIGSTTIETWSKKGREGKAPYAGFWAAINAARAQAKADAIKAVRAGTMGNMQPDWKAEAWFLERTFPAEYGPQQAVNVKVEKELDRVLEDLEKKLAPDVYNLVLSAIAGEAGGEATGEPEDGE